MLVRELTPNPQTGFLESNNSVTLESFTSDKKLRFLELAMQYAEQRQLPDVMRICDAVAIKYRTLTEHLNRDEKFKAAWDDIRRRVYFGLSNELSIKSNSKNGIVANLAVLKYLERGKFSEDELFATTDNAGVKGVFGRINNYIDAETVDNAPDTKDNGT